MLYHVVLMNFKDDTTEEDIQELERRLDDLPNHIMEIQMYEFGRDIVRSGRSSDFALISMFANLPAMQRYQEHPEHLKVLEQVRKVCENVHAADFEIGFPEREEEENLPFNF
jgi:hypothetical protein